MVAMVLVVAHVRACRSGDPPLIRIPLVIEVPSAAAPAGALPPADPQEVPTVTVACADSTTELLANGDTPVLCWGERCLAYRGELASSAARPEAPEHEAVAVVVADRVCSGTRCDPLGRHLREAIDGIEGKLEATRDHAAIVIAYFTGRFAVWNRAADRPLDLGPATDNEGEIVNIDVIGDRLIVARSCKDDGSAIASIVDARGRRQGGTFPVDPRWDHEPANLVELDPDRFVALDRFGDVALIEHGRTLVSENLRLKAHHMPSMVIAKAVRLNGHVLAVYWCSDGVDDTACHLARIYATDGEIDREPPSLAFDGEVALPRCAP